MKLRECQVTNCVMLTALNCAAASKGTNLWVWLVAVLMWPTFVLVHNLIVREPQ